MMLVFLAIRVPPPHPPFVCLTRTIPVPMPIWLKSCPSQEARRTASVEAVGKHGGRCEEEAGGRRGRGDGLVGGRGKIIEYEEGGGRSTVQECFRESRALTLADSRIFDSVFTTSS
jgi:hypothetical protein